MLKKKTKSPTSILRKIKFLLLDVDGVMTDGGIYYSTSGEELKKFDIKDGYGIVKLQQAGIRIGILTGRMSNIVARRAADLGITEVHQNLENKLGTYQSIISRLQLLDSEVAYIGDDEFDLEVLKRVGFSAAPADAMPEVKKIVHYVCDSTGGNGAVREVINFILSKRKQTR
jgi:3-deoxy-D-manno-octulosonate 8-phosphate phosphatase (KDO 8-P phosphatase)